MTDLGDTIRARALGLGFDAVGFTAPEVSQSAKTELQSFLSQGLHGDMGWLSMKADRRSDPKVLWPEARSVVMLAANYGPREDPMARLGRRDRATISVYAQNKDYHDVLKRRLKALAGWMQAEYGCAVKVFVDTAPVMEKPLAMSAGLGWQGKHTNLVSREFGSWLFLGEIYSDLELAPDTAEADHCGSCRRCLDVCPTDAFPGPYRIDARRCISYLTIEYKGHIPEEFRKSMGNRIYGCDDCLAVCPWNKFAAPTVAAEFLPRAELRAPRLRDLAKLSDADFRQVFAGSPVKRTGRDRIVRNVLIAMGNSGDPENAEVAADLLSDASPLVRAMAVWCLKQLLPAGQFAAQRERWLSNEQDNQVREEWSSRPAGA